MLSILCVRLTIKVKVGIPESFKVGWYPLKKTGSSHLKDATKINLQLTLITRTFKAHISATLKGSTPGTRLKYYRGWQRTPSNIR